MMTSVSEVDWKMEPESSNSFRNISALTRLPLCEIAMGPLRIFDDKGLSVFQMTLALSGVAIVADGPWSLPTA